MRGPLLYSLPIGLNFTLLNHYYGYRNQSNDYQILPSTAWNYALEVNPANPEDYLKFVQGKYQPGSAPFNHTNYPQYIMAQGKLVNGWGIKTNSADLPPDSPACSKPTACGSLQNVTQSPQACPSLERQCRDKTHRRRPRPLCAAIVVRACRPIRSPLQSDPPA